MVGYILYQGEKNRMSHVILLRMYRKGMLRRRKLVFGLLHFIDLTLAYLSLGP